LPSGKQKEFKERILQKFRESGVEVRHLWNPLHVQPLFTGCKVYDNKQAISLFEKGICLPSGFSNEGEQFQKVIQILRSIF
jgi:dTDP-4-amino-4,6-dideoxygalactose transaminase